MKGCVKEFLIKNIAAFVSSLAVRIAGRTKSYCITITRNMFHSYYIELLKIFEGKGGHSKAIVIQENCKTTAGYRKDSEISFLFQLVLYYLN